MEVLWMFRIEQKDVPTTEKINAAELLESTEKILHKLDYYDSSSFFFSRHAFEINYLLLC